MATRRVDFPRGERRIVPARQAPVELRDPDAQNYYSDLERFYAALMRADETLGLLASNRVEHKHPHHVQDDTGVLAFHCGGALVVANLHPHESYPAYRVGSAVAGRFRLELDTDAAEFGGWGRLDPDTEVVTEGGSCDWQGTGVTLYLPSRSAQVYALVDEWDVPEMSGTIKTPFRIVRDDEYDTGGGETMPCGSEEEVRGNASREKEDGSWGNEVSARVVVVAGARLNASQRSLHLIGRSDITPAGASAGSPRTTRRRRRLRGRTHPTSRDVDRRRCRPCARRAARPSRRDARRRRPRRRPRRSGRPRRSPARGFAPDRARRSLAPSPRVTTARVSARPPRCPPATAATPRRRVRRRRD